MNPSETEAFVESLENVQREENFGYTFFFIGDDNFVPFVTIAQSDSEYDSVSNLDREGVFRINIGISRDTYQSMFADFDTENIDYSALNVFLPHPEYAKQHFICILSPSGENVEATKDLIREAHARALDRFNRKQST